MSCSCELVSLLSVFFFKQKTAYEMRISDWSSDVCSSDLFLVLENDLNAAHRLVRDTDERPLFYTAQWNDDYHHAMHEIGRASCRERVCQYVYIAVVAVTLKKKTDCTHRQSKRKYTHTDLRQ